MTLSGTEGLIEPVTMVFSSYNFLRKSFLHIFRWRFELFSSVFSTFIDIYNFHLTDVEAFWPGLVPFGALCAVACYKGRRAFRKTFVA